MKNVSHYLTSPYSLWTKVLWLGSFMWQKINAKVHQQGVERVNSTYPSCNGKPSSLITFQQYKKKKGTLLYFTMCEQLTTAFIKYACQYLHPITSKTHSLDPNNFKSKKIKWCLENIYWDQQTMKIGVRDFLDFCGFFPRELKLRK